MPHSLHPSSARWRLACRVLLLALVVVISVLALMPAPPRAADLGWDKANHALAFAVLAAVVSAGDGPWPLGRWRAAGALLAYGVAIEVAQSFTATRSAEWRDVVADAVGIAIGQGLAAAGWRAWGLLGRR